MLVRELIVAVEEMDHEKRRTRRSGWIVTDVAEEFRSQELRWPGEVGNNFRDSNTLSFYEKDGTLTGLLFRPRWPLGFGIGIKTISLKDLFWRSNCTDYCLFSSISVRFFGWFTFAACLVRTSSPLTFGEFASSIDVRNFYSLNSLSF